MLCDSCNQNEATIHIVRVLDGEKTEQNLCEKCARANKELDFSFEPQFSLHKLFSSLIDQKLHGSREKGLLCKLQCPDCGLSFAQFSQVGRFGCSSCIETFEEKMKPLLSRIQAGSVHSGKVPARFRSRIKLRRELKALQEELQEKIKSERFEDAAVLRDRVRVMEKEIREEDTAKGEEL